MAQYESKASLLQKYYYKSMLNIKILTIFLFLTSSMCFGVECSYIEGALQEKEIRNHKQTIDLDKTPPKVLAERPSNTTKGARDFLGVLLARYYSSFIIEQERLPGNYPKGAEPYDEINPNDQRIQWRKNFFQLLSYAKVRQKLFPMLIPLSSTQDDSHQMRMDRWTLAADPVKYNFKNEIKNPDIPNTDILVGVMYQFEGHGESKKMSNCFIGQRLELIRPIRVTTKENTTSDNLEVYEKVRFNEDLEPIARTIVIKSGEFTNRIRIETHDERIDIAKILEFNKISVSDIAYSTPFVRYRYTVKIGERNQIDSIKPSETLSGVADIGRMNIDLDIRLNWIKSDFDGGLAKALDFIKPKTYGNKLFYVAVGNQEFTSLINESKPGMIKSVHSRLSVESIPEADAQIKTFWNDLQNFLYEQNFPYKMKDMSHIRKILDDIKKERNQ